MDEEARKNIDRARIQSQLMTLLTEEFLEKTTLEKRIALYDKSELENIDPYKGKEERFNKIEKMLEPLNGKMDKYWVHWLFNELEHKALEMIRVLSLLVQTTDPNHIKKQIPDLSGIPEYLVKNAIDTLGYETKKNGKLGGETAAKAFDENIKSKALIEYESFREGRRTVSNVKNKVFKYGEHGQKSAFANTMSNEKGYCYNSVIKWWDQWEKKKS